jgi:hypothetical protein
VSTEIRVALVDFLEEDAALKALATGGVWFDIGDDRINAAPPYVIISKPTGDPQFAFQGNEWNWDIWLVKGLGPVAVAEAMDKRCRELLTDADLMIPGRSVQMIRPISDINYPEVVDGERYQHVGAKYRITSEGSK